MLEIVRSSIAVAVASRVGGVSAAEGGRERERWSTRRWIRIVLTGLVRSSWFPSERISGVGRVGPLKAHPLSSAVVERANRAPCL